MLVSEIPPEQTLVRSRHPDRRDLIDIFHKRPAGIVHAHNASEPRRGFHTCSIALMQVLGANNGVGAVLFLSARGISKPWNIAIPIHGAPAT